MIFGEMEKLSDNKKKISISVPPKYLLVRSK